MMHNISRAINARAPKQVRHNLRSREASENHKENVWFTLAHDMRNLLAGVDAVLKLASQESATLTPRVRQLLGDAQANCEMMEGMLGDVLDAYLMKKRQETSTPSEVDLILMIEKCVRLLRFMAEEKNITLQIALPENAPKIKLDEQKFMRVFLNLLHNAVKFSPRGKRVEVDVRLDGSQSLVVSVTDLGQGVTRHQAQRILSANCYQENPRPEGSATGYGLGLFYCITAVPVMGGEMWIESPPSGSETGSKFGFKLPLSQGNV